MKKKEEKTGVRETRSTVSGWRKQKKIFIKLWKREQNIRVTKGMENIIIMVAIIFLISLAG